MLDAVLATLGSSRNYCLQYSLILAISALMVVFIFAKVHAWWAEAQLFIIMLLAEHSRSNEGAESGNIVYNDGRPSLLAVPQ